MLFFKRTTIIRSTKIIMKCSYILIKVKSNKIVNFLFLLEYNQIKIQFDIQSEHNNKNRNFITCVSKQFEINQIKSK